MPRLLVWLVLVLTLRRALNYDKALNWMLSGLRWMAGWLPAQSKLVSDGAISHARVKLGAEVYMVMQLYNFAIWGTIVKKLTWEKNHVPRIFGSNSSSYAARRQLAGSAGLQRASCTHCARPVR